MLLIIDALWLSFFAVDCHRAWIAQDFFVLENGSDLFDYFLHYLTVLPKPGPESLPQIVVDLDEGVRHLLRPTHHQLPARLVTQLFERVVKDVIFC
jgi:hypothetical protein